MPATVERIGSALAIKLVKTGPQGIPGEDGGGGGISSGDTLPATPAENDLFIHSKAATYRVLKVYNGSQWLAVENLNRTALDLYVDPVNGTDSVEHGYGSGVNAVQTLSYLAGLSSFIPGIPNGQPVNIYVAGGATLTGTIYLQQRNSDINVQGVPTDIQTGLSPSGQAGNVITYAGQAWSVNEHAGRWLKSNIDYYYIISNTADTLTVRENLTISIGVADTIQEFPTFQGVLFSYNDRFSLKYFNIVANATNFLLNIYGADYTHLKAVNITQLSSFLGRCVYFGLEGGAVLAQDINIESSVSSSQNVWINACAWFTASNLRGVINAATTSTAWNILLKASRLNMSHSYIKEAGILVEHGSSLSNSNTVANSIEIENAFVGVQSDISSVVDTTDYVFTNCTTDVVSL